MLKRLWRQLAIASNWPILAAVIVLTVAGVVSIYSDDPFEGKKQLFFLPIAIGVMFAMQLVSYTVLARYAAIFYISAMGLLLYTVVPWKVPGVETVKGARNWINFGLLKLQPAELMKVAFCGMLALHLRFRSNSRTWTGLVAPFLLAGIPLLIILKQPDLGTALVFIPALFIMLFVAGARFRHLALIFALGLALGLFAWFCGDEASGGPNLPLLRHFPTLVKNYQRDRVKAMFSADLAVLQKTGYQQHRALIALGSGGWTGRGAGNIPFGHYIPERHNDMIFALIGEQFGFVGAAIVLFAYLVLFTAGIEIAGNTKEPFGRLVAVGIVSLLAAQTFINLLVCLKLMPVTGVTLPFVSYGGSSLLASYIAAGLLLNIGQNRPLMIGKDNFE